MSDDLILRAEKIVTNVNCENPFVFSVLEKKKEGKPSNKKYLMVNG